MSWRFFSSLLIEFGPLILFFFGTERWGFIEGSWLLVLSVPVSLTWAYVRDKRFAVFPFMVGMLVILLGSATVITGDAKWIQLEYTIYNGFFGTFLLAGFLTNQGFLKRLFETMFAITDYGWRILSLRWGLWMLGTAIANAAFSMLYSPEAWVTFRIASSLAGFLFAFAQLELTARERLPQSSAWGLRL